MHLHCDAFVSLCRSCMQDGWVEHYIGAVGTILKLCRILCIVLAYSTWTQFVGSMQPAFANAAAVNGPATEVHVATR